MKKSISGSQQPNLWVYFIPMIIGFFVTGLSGIGIITSKGGSGSDMGVGFFVAMIIYLPILSLVYLAFVGLSVLPIFLARKQRVLQIIISITFAGVSLFIPWVFNSAVNHIARQQAAATLSNAEAIQYAQETGTITRCKDIQGQYQSWRECIDGGFVRLSQYDECLAQENSRDLRSTEKVCVEIRDRLKKYPQWKDVSECSPSIPSYIAQEDLTAAWEEWQWCLDKTVRTEEDKTICVQQSAEWESRFPSPSNKCSACLTYNQPGTSNTVKLPCR